MAFFVYLYKSVTVSLFTREWIEIVAILDLVLAVQSPSLRGSGLK